MIRIATSQYRTPLFSHTQQTGTNNAFYAFSNPFGRPLTSLEMYFVDCSTSAVAGLASGSNWRANAYYGSDGTNHYGYTWSSTAEDVEIRAHRMTNIPAGASDAFCLFFA